MVSGTTWSLEDLVAYSRAGSWRPLRLTDIVAGWVRTQPGTVAVIDARSRVTYAELDARADRLAVALLDAGVRPGDVVSFKLPNWHESAVVLLAAERIGAVVSPIALTTGAHELAGLLAAGGCRVLVAVGEYRGRDHAAEAAGLLREQGSAALVVAVGPTADPACTDFDDLVLGDGSTPASEAIFAQLAGSAARVSHLAFSSGSTGIPRGILHSHNSLVSTVHDYIQLQRFVPGDVFHVPLPVGYSGGFVYGVRLALQAGGTAVLQERWNPEEMLALVESHRAVYSTGTPTHVMDVIGAARPGALDSLRIYNCGGAHAADHVVDAAVAALGTVYCRSYGMTECHRLATTDANTPVELLRTTDGRVQPGMAVRVVDEEGRALPPGAEGLVHVKGPYLFTGYLDPTSTEAAVVGGWFDTGDLGRVDADGFIAITGRVKDVIVRGGAKIPAAAVEGVVLEHPAVRGVALVPLPDERLGEVAAACVVLDPGRSLTLAELLRFLDGKGVTKQHWPSSLQVFDELPRTPTGKVRKAQVVEMLRAAGA